MALATKGWLTEISLPVYILIVIFNLASWIDLNALWVEMPLMVNRLPEGWELPIYIFLIVQCSKVGLIAYAILKKYLKDRLQEWPFVYFIVGVGSACMLSLGFVWEKTMVIGGKEVSFAVMAMTASLSFVDSMSSVVFLPYMSRFRPQYITAFFLGDGICQLLPVIVSMVQGVSESPDCENVTMVTYNETLDMNITEYVIIASYPEPKFSVRAFFGFMFCIMCCSGVAFSFLHFHPYCKKEHVDHIKIVQKKRQSALEKKSKIYNPKPDLEKGKQIKIIEMEPLQNRKSTGDFTEGQSDSEANGTLHGNQPVTSGREAVISQGDFAFVMAITAWIFGLMYGIIPSIQAFSCLPYGSRAFNLAIRLGLAMNPAVSVLALFISTRSKALITCMTILGTIASAYQIFLACVSPYPPLKGTAIGETLAIASFVIIMGLFNYVRSCLMYILHEKGGKGGLMWGGVSMHIGSTIGAILIFIITKVMQPFESEPPCVGM